MSCKLFWNQTNHIISHLLQVYCICCVWILICRWEASSLMKRSVSGQDHMEQAAAGWSIIYYRTSLLLYVTNAFHRDGLPEVNAAQLTPVPTDKHCQCLIQKRPLSAEHLVCLSWGIFKKWLYFKGKLSCQIRFCFSIEQHVANVIILIAFIINRQTGFILAQENIMILTLFYV